MSKINIDLNEKILVERLVGGDVFAFEKLYILYAQHITSHLFNLLKSQDLVEEVLQETFVALWENRHLIDPEKSFRGYLFKIATNKTYKHFRKSLQDQVYKSHLMDFGQKVYYAIDDYITDKENEELVQRLLQQMPKRQREVFVLFKLEGYTYQEISQHIGITKATINTHLTRANEFLKRQLIINSEYFPIAFIIFLAY